MDYADDVLVPCLQTEQIFHTYAQYASMAKPPPQPTEDELRLESQLKDLLERVRTAI